MQLLEEEQPGNALAEVPWLQTASAWLTDSASEECAAHATLTVLPSGKEVTIHVCWLHLSRVYASEFAPGAVLKTPGGLGHYCPFRSHLHF